MCYRPKYNRIIITHDDRQPKDNVNPRFYTPLHNPRTIRVEIFIQLLFFKKYMYKVSTMNDCFLVRN